MIRFPVKAKSYEQLKTLSQPQARRGGASECYAHAFYDTESYVDVTTLFLDFFVTTKANRQLSNLSPAGALPVDMFFEIYHFMVDVLYPKSDVAWADYQMLLQGTGAEGGPIFSFILADKNYGPWPLTLLHGTGGITGFGLGPAAAAVEEYANNSIPDGSLFQDGALVIPPNTGFSARIEWAATCDIAANKYLRLTMAGVLHRAIR